MSSPVYTKLRNNLHVRNSLLEKLEVFKPLYNLHKVNVNIPLGQTAREDMPLQTFEQVISEQKAKPRIEWCDRLQRFLNLLLGKKP